MPKIIKATIEQNSAVPCDDNIISVCLRTNLPMVSENVTIDVQTERGSVIQQVPLYKNINIKGLRGSCAPYQTANGQIPITGLGEHANKFDFGNWSAATGELNVAMRSRVENDTDVCFNFTLRNPSCSQGCAAAGKITVNITSDSKDPLYYPPTTAQPHVRVRSFWTKEETALVPSDYDDLESQGGCPELGWGAAKSLVGGRCALKVVEPMVVYHDIGQSDPYPCSDNTITVNATFNVPLLCPCGAAGVPTITVSGLGGTLSTQFSNLSLTVGGVAGLGVWDPTGTLVVHLGSAKCAVGYQQQNNTLITQGGSVETQAGASSSFDCARLCDADSACVAYEYSQVEGKCYKNSVSGSATAPTRSYAYCAKKTEWKPSPCNVLAMRFTVRNGKEERQAAKTSLSVCSINGGKSVEMVNPAKKDLAPLFVRSGAIKAKICQATPWPGAENTLTVTLSANIPLRTACKSAIVISNLDQACMEGVADFTADGNTYPSACYSAGTLALNSAAATNVAITGATAIDKFTNPAGWSYDYDAARQVHGGKLTLTIKQDTVVDEEYVVSFKFMNPSFGQASPPIRISGTGIPVAGILPEKCTAFGDKSVLNTCTGTPLSCNVEDSDAAPLNVRPPEFLENQIGQSRPYPCVIDNVIKVTLRANVGMPVNAAITLTNLDGIDLDSRYLGVTLLTDGIISEATASNQLVGPGDAATAYTAPAGSGAWDYELKKLTLQISGAAIPAFKRFVFQFTVKNPCCNMPSPPVCVKVNRITAPCNNCTAVGRCGTCASIPRQMLDRDFYTVFASGSDGGYYNYNNTVYNKDTAITYGKADLGDAYPLLTYKPGFIPLKKAIGQSSPFPSVNNTITVTIATKTPLTVGATLTISGLSGTASNSRPDLPIQDAGTAEGQSATTVFGSSGEWKNSGTLTLTVTSESIAGVQYVFSFKLTNPSCNMDFKTVTATATCCKQGSCLPYSLILDPEVNKTSTCHSQVGDTRPLQVIKPSFVTRNIWQSNPFPCQNNTISLELDTNVDLLPRTRITVLGLTGSDTPTSTLPVEVCGTQENGTWTRSTGVLIFQLTSLQAACSACRVTFQLKNKCCCQPSPVQNVKVHADMNCFNQANVVVLPAANITLLDASVKQPVAQELSPLHIRCPSWKVNTIAQSSKFPCADNVLTMNLSFNVPIPSGSGMTLTLTGLHDTQTLTNYPAYKVGNVSGRPTKFENETCLQCACSVSGILSPVVGKLPRDCNATACECVQQPRMPVIGAPIITEQAGLFNPSANNGELKVKMDGSAEAHELITFNFTVINPKAPVSAQDVSVRVDGVFDTFMCQLPPTVLVNQNAGPIMHVLVPALTVKDVGQSTPWPCAKNTISVSLSSNVPLSGSHVHCKPQITISGFKSGCVKDKTIVLAGLNGSAVFNGNGTWLAAENAIVVSPRGVMLENTIGSFSFDIQNPSESQPSPQIQIAMSDISVSRTDMNKDCANGLASKKCPKLADTVVGSQNGAIYEAGVRDAEPLRVHAPVFLTRNIGQNNSYPGAQNRISVTIRTNVDIPVGGTVTISVLNSACSASGPLEIYDVDESYNSTLGDELHFAAKAGGSGGAGLWDDAEKMLKLYLVKNMTAGTFYTFGFDVRNPHCDQPPQPVCIRAKGVCSGSGCEKRDLVIPRRLMIADLKSKPSMCGSVAGDAAPLLVKKPIITAASLSHDSPWPSAYNNLTLTFSTSVPLVASVLKPRITVKGLTGVQTTSGTIEVKLDGRTLQADWKQGVGELVVNVTFDTQACTNYTLSFMLQNRKCQNPVPSVSLAISGDSASCSGRGGVCFEDKLVKLKPLQACSLTTHPLQVIGGSCSGAGASFATFSTKRVYQSSSRPGCNNTITVELMANLPIPAHSGQFIKIQFDKQKVMCVNSYNVQPYFNPSWKDNTLQLEVVQSMAACTYYNITFEVTNDIAKQIYSSALISAVGPVSIFESAPEAMTMKDDIKLRPFQVDEPRYTVSNIGQSSPYPGATGANANTLCVTVQSNALIGKGSVVNISGLEGAIAPDGEIDLTGNSTLFTSLNGTTGKGTWSNCAKTLNVQVASDLGFCGDQSVSFCFVVSNPLAPQVCADVQIEVTHIATCNGDLTSLSRIPMTGDETTVLSTIPGAYAGDACPMVVWSAAFCVKDIGQSSALPCDINTITVTLATNVPLYPVIDYPASWYGDDDFMNYPRWQAPSRSVYTSITIEGFKGAVIEDAGNSNAKTSIAIKDASGSADVAQFEGSKAEYTATDSGFKLVLKMANTSSCCQGSNKVIFSFKVKNPSTAPAGIISSPKVEANGIHVLSSSMHEAMGDKKPMHIKMTAISSAHIAQSVNLPCQTNTITVTLKTTGVLAACKASLTVTGLPTIVRTKGLIPISATGYNISQLSVANTTQRYNVSSPSNYTTVVHAPNVFNAHGNWSTPDLVIGFDSLPAGTVTFTFSVTNPAGPIKDSAGNVLKPAVYVSLYTKNVALVTPKKMMIPSDQTLQPITVLQPAFTDSDITQSSPYPAAPNVITVMLQANVPLNTKCKVNITISGFEKACLSDLNTFTHLGGLNAVYADFTKAWDADTKQLTIGIKANSQSYNATVSTLANHNMIKFSVQVKNPVTPQVSPKIEAVSSGITMQKYELKKNVANVIPSSDSSFTAQDARPLEIRGPGSGYSFDVKKIGQSSAEPGGLNEITVTLASNVPLTASSPVTKVTISGLVGALLRSQLCNASAAGNNCSSTSGLNANGDLITFMDSNPNFQPAWDDAKKKIVLTVTENTTPKKEYTLKFYFKNPASAQNSPRVYIEASGIPVVPTAMVPDVTTLIKTIDDDGAAVNSVAGFAAPLAIVAPKLVSKSVYQMANGQWPGADNVLTISFQSTVALKSTAIAKVAVVIKGLYGARLERNSRLVSSGAPDVAITNASNASSALTVACNAGSSGDVFMYAGSVPSFGGLVTSVASADPGCAACPAVPKCPVLDGSAASPSLTVAIDDVPALTNVEFTVSFKNALEAQASQALTIEIISCNASLFIPATKLPVKSEYQGTNQEPLTIVASAPFLVKKLCQSSPCTSATNTITVSLQPKFALSGAKGAEVTIRGLKGSESADGMLTLLTGTPTFESHAKWRQSSGTLILKVATGKTVATDKVTVVQFDITNPRYQQNAPETIEISASGDVPHAAVCMDTCAGVEAPLHVTSGAFVNASVGSSSSVAGAKNTITVTMKPTCALLCEGRESVVTVEGLVGSMEADRALLPVTMLGTTSKTLFKAQMSDLAVSFTHSCALADNKAVLTGVTPGANPVGSLIQFSTGTCKDRYTKIKAFDAKTSCATLETSATWTDGAVTGTCALGAVSSIKVALGGEGFKSGEFIVDSNTGSGLTGKCVVDPAGVVTSIEITTAGSGYNADTTVRCPRACSVEQQKLLSTCSCGCCGCGCNANKTTDAACEPIDDFGLKVTTSLANPSPVIAGACSWSKDAGRLTCPIQGCMKADAATEFSVQITNGMSSQCGQDVNVMAGGKNPIGAVALTGKAMEIVAATNPSESATAVCVCRACDTTSGSTPAVNYTCATPGNATMGAKCSCTAKFSDLDATKTYGLGADLQCNFPANITKMKIAGTETALTGVTQAPSTCNDKCSSYHRLFSSMAIAKSDTSSGTLEVEFESETAAGPVDYCGSGDQFKAVLSITPMA